MSDPGKYRTRQEIQETRENRDPIERVKSFILHNNFANEEDLKKMDNIIKTEVLDASDKARDMSLPDDSTLYTDVYDNLGTN